MNTFKPILTFIAVLSLCVPLSTHATEAFSSGAELKGWCDNMERDDIHWGMCVGSITAAHDMVMSYQNFEDMNQLVCVPSDTSRADAIKAVIAYMKDHPEDLDFSLGDLVLSALIDKFPCH